MSPFSLLHAGLASRRAPRENISSLIWPSPVQKLGCPDHERHAPEIPIENIKDGIVPKLDLRVTDEDFQAVLTLIEPLYRHSSYVLGFLPTSEAVPVQTSPEQALFNALPMMFCRRQAVDVAAKNGIPEKTLDSSLKRMLEKGTLIKTARGEYAFSSHVCVRERRPKE